MVYCGRPSKSCRRCRNRNIKCDKKLPSCGQCTRAQLNCPGYHNSSALIIRDQTASTIHKSKKSSTKTCPQIQNPIATHQTTVQTQLPPQIDVPIEVRAKNLFIAHHVFGIGTGGILTLSYMKAFHPPRPEDLHLISTLRAVSLAYLSHVSNSSAVLNEARKHYDVALSMTNKLLSKPETALDDKTLHSILMLHLFEAFARRTSNYLGGGEEGEGRHLMGAMALVRLRGRDQFRREDGVGLAMFHHLSEKILVRCLKGGLSVPAEFLLLRRQVREFVDVESVEWRLGELMISVLGVGKLVRKGGLERKDALERLKGLDGEVHGCVVGRPKDSGYDFMMKREFKKLFPRP